MALTNPRRQGRPRGDGEAACCPCLRFCLMRVLIAVPSRQTQRRVDMAARICSPTFAVAYRHRCRIGKGTCQSPSLDQNRIAGAGGRPDFWVSPLTPQLLNGLVVANAMPARYFPHACPFAAKVPATAGVVSTVYDNIMTLRSARRMATCVDEHVNVSKPHDGSQALIFGTNSTPSSDTLCAGREYPVGIASEQR